MLNELRKDLTVAYTNPEASGPYDRAYVQNGQVQTPSLSPWAYVSVFGQNDGTIFSILPCMYECRPYT